jgi:hypothetical protein
MKMISRKSLTRCLNCARDQEISEVHENRNHILETLVHEAETSQTYDHISAEITLAKIFAPSPGDIAMALEKVREARRRFGVTDYAERLFSASQLSPEELRRRFAEL